MKNNALRKIDVLVIDRNDTARYYTAYVLFMNANKKYVMDLLRKKSLIGLLDNEGFNRASGNIIRFNSKFDMVSFSNKYEENTIINTYL